VLPTPVEGVRLLQRAVHSDARGTFSRLHCAEEYESLGLSGFTSPAQMNLSLTEQPGTVRGMHLLRGPATEHKLVTCLAGRIHDVVIDLRENSPTFMETFSAEFDGAGSLSVVIPPGVAHGFQALEPQSLVLYLHSERYRAELDAGVRADDPALGLEWPLPISLISPRDQALPLAADYLG
jgi:dTDP-4-dehydrorhamnose 3,5-epimerase